MHHEKTKTKETSTTTKFPEAYSEEAKLKIYTSTGVMSTLLVVAIIGFTVVTIKKRNERKSDTFAGPKNNFSLKKSKLEISSPLEPWTTNEEVRKAFPNIVRSTAWFDSLQRSHMFIFSVFYPDTLKNVN